MEKLNIACREAVEIILKKAEELGKKLEYEEVEIEHATGRVSYEDVVSPVSLPPFRRAMVDGFALRARDTFSATKYSPAKLKIIAKLDAGNRFKSELEENSAIKVNTGAQLPASADAVVKVEDCEEKGGYVHVFSPIPKGKNVGEVGEDLKKGEKILFKFQEIQPQDIALLAACGIRKVRVFRKIKASIIATGSELVTPGNKLEEGKIYDANSFLIISFLKSLGCEIENSGIVEDSREKIEEKIKEADGDFLLISGATSKGEKDFVPEVIKGIGKMHFRGVRIRPGHPFSFGTACDKPAFLLPGFPVACFVILELFLKPFIKKAYNQSMESRRIKLKAELKHRIASKLGIAEFVRLRVFRGKNKIFAEKVATKGAGVITTLTKANAYAIIPENIEGLREGEEIEAYLLREDEVS